MKLRLSLALASGVALVVSNTLSAQSPPRTPAQADPRTPAQADPRTPPPEGAPPRQPRPQAQALKLPNLPEVPTQVLDLWSNATKGIEKMDGEVRRIEYDFVFMVEKQSEGKFWFAAPDKGRLDLEGLPFEPGTKSRREGFTLGIGDTDEWICDGSKIYQIVREQKEVNIFPIPDDAQGANIMHGPLPFLFGMPPDTARQRYWLFLKKHDEKYAYIVAYPKWAADRQNYLWAEIILDKKSFLPMAVKLRSPADNAETVYTFEGVKANRKSIFPQRNPFVPNIDGLHKNIHDPAARQPAPPVVQAGPATMPSLVGLPGREVVELCKKLEVEPKFYRGEPAANEKLKHVVYKQTPAPKAPIEKGQVIKVMVYDDPEATAKN